MLLTLVGYLRLLDINVFLCCFRVNLEPSRTLMVGDRSVE